jgi:pantothenate kinase type III
MLLTIDIGNTNIKLALFKGEKIFFIRRLPANKDQKAKQCQRTLKTVFKPAKIKTLDIEAILICSVAPKLTLVNTRLR